MSPSHSEYRLTVVPLIFATCGIVRLCLECRISVCQMIAPTSTVRSAGAEPLRKAVAPAAPPAKLDCMILHKPLWYIRGATDTTWEVGYERSIQANLS